MSYSNERLCSALARTVRDKLAKLNYRIGTETSPNRLYGMKDRLLRGAADISIPAKNRFTAVFSSSHFNEAVLRDAYFGRVRINKLASATQVLRTGNAATAWTLTTSYYAGFFSALEMLRCTGAYVTHFEEQEIYAIRQLSMHVLGPTEAGTYLATARYNDIEQNVSIEFIKTATRHHQFVWQSIRPLILQSLKSAGLQESNFGTSVREVFAESSVPTPSDTRNLWNYADATLFSKRGDAVGADFSKLIDNIASPFGYFSTRKVLHSEKHQASSIALCSAVLRQSFELLATYVLPQSLSVN